MLKDPKKTKDAVVQWIRDYFAKNLPNATAVVGISGGKDSSVSAALCVEALGRDRVIGVLMPDGNQSDISDSYTLVKHLQIRYLEVNIQKMTEAFKSTFLTLPGFSDIAGHEGLAGEAWINTPPRIRMTTLYAIAQSVPGGGLVINTCNRSEDHVGYSTKFGDAAGDLSPLSSFTVHEVLQIGTELNLPESLVKKTPSDGLSGMSDEDKLGFTYAVLDQYLDTGVCPDPEAKEKIDRLNRRNLHKLLPMPTYKKSEDD
ncbi:MAG: NAD(+) synthase [Lachnospiraceae bacterium]|nr:NAD(+) synthase [Lachnospiraceae bacterium]